MECGIHASGTFNANPVGVAAALATVEELSKPGVYEYLNHLGQMLEEGFRALAEKYQMKLYLRHVGSVFVLYFGYDQDVEDFRDWLTKADVDLYERFVEGCEAYGVRFTDPQRPGVSVHGPHRRGHSTDPGSGRPGFGRNPKRRAIT